MMFSTVLEQVRAFLRSDKERELSYYNYSIYWSNNRQRSRRDV